jgi:hypothetical protein
MKYLLIFLMFGLTSTLHSQKNEDFFGNVKPPNVKAPKCKEVEGYHSQFSDSIPEGYTGILFSCGNNCTVYWMQECKNGKKDGYARQFNTGDGRCWYESNYKNGKLHGYTRQWYDNNQLDSEVLFENGEFKSGKCFDREGKRIECSDI